MADHRQPTELEAALAELETINRVLGRICQVNETNHIMSIIVEELVRLTGAAQGVINLVHPEDHDLLETVIRDAGADTRDESFKVDDQIMGWVLKNKQLLKIDDLDADSRFSGLSSRNGRCKSIICCPMMARGEIIGLTSLVRDDSSGPFTDNQCRVAGIISSQSAQILSNAVLLHELARKNELLELAQQNLRSEYARLQNEVAPAFAFENIIGKSAAMKQVLTMASKVSVQDIPVLITGPTGTGKELIAKAIHYNSRRRARPFVIKNCGVKTESLLESELFGHVKGAFTGADRTKAGLFKEADGGTIFLDEIGDAPPSTQMAILRVLETGEIRPIGAGRTEFVDVRVISATNADLRKKITAGDFREDLYYRLNAMTIEMPPLSRRREDIPLLVHHFLGKYAAKLGRDRLSITPEAMTALGDFEWPGNIRQLENEIERAAVVCDPGGAIDIRHLSREIAHAGETRADRGGYRGQMREVVEQVEREMIIDALTATGGNILQSSQQLGLTRKGLKDKLARYDIDPGRF
jgi:transcriptional regulator with GAF, ATPase, and Fis domain